METNTPQATPPPNGKGPSAWRYLITGVAFIVVGALLSNQPWTKPAMFEALGLDLSKVITNIGVFIVFIPVIRIYFYQPLMEIMDARNRELETAFTDAENLRGEMKQLRADYEERLAETEANAREQIQAQIKEAQNLRQQLMAEAASKADEMRTRATAEIEQERSRVLTELRLDVVDLTLKATEKLLGEVVDSEANRKLVQDFIERVEVAG
jgi:F-type H+-transporting ATPase subunit b